MHFIRQKFVIAVEKRRLQIAALSSSESSIGHFALVLEEVNGNRRLPIIIGPPEAQAIALEMEHLRPQRPMTHDLMFNICFQFDLRLKEVVITDLLEGVFYAKLMFEHHDIAEEIDSRPSDAIALAVRFNVPIYTVEKVLQEAGIEIQGETENEEHETSAAVSVAEPEKSKSLSEQVAELNEKLEDALKSEDYELAARLRDTIKKMMGEN
ncbi:MAG: bifunctional nuclease domain-containing protein [Bacteroidia bacterium]